MEGESKVVLDAEPEEDVLQRRASRLVRLGEGNLEIVKVYVVFSNRDSLNGACMVARSLVKLFCASL